MGETIFSTAQSYSDDLSEIAGQLHADPALVFLFASPQRDFQALAAAARQRWQAPILGCSTAGEIGPADYGSGGVSACSFAKDSLRAYPLLIDNPQQPDPAALAAWRDSWADACPPGHGVAVLLVDALMQCEEHLSASIQPYLLGRPLIGGSAGDDLAFQETPVLYNHFLGPGRAVLCMLVGLRFVPRTFHLQDLHPLSQDLVVTQASPERRVIQEIDGQRAILAYAQAIQRPAEEITEDDLAAHSLMLKIGGQTYIRSVSTITPDGGLLIHAAIDEGMIIQVGRSGNTLHGLQQGLHTDNLLEGCVAGSLIFECIRRRQELQEQGSLAEAAQLFAQAKSCGFATYGEIANGLHVNQTCSGVIFVEQA